MIAILVVERGGPFLNTSLNLIYGKVRRLYETLIFLPPTAPNSTLQHTI
jgi:hypothetical protein